MRNERGGVLQKRGLVAPWIDNSFLGWFICSRHSPQGHSWLRETDNKSILVVVTQINRIWKLKDYLDAKHRRSLSFGKK
ncbi:hypothetical protein AMELA_G00171260 [Ameiurus melas]|uniref:Uncharacterized protein n=1 Tax=Ameiurus melas TaxID=219545 RepID=A0A7J6ACA0_AMEME|nr:hypothetical protein AMELA_G00171260 [Ameiurus melas]